jgi:hypothetical protein
MIAAFSDPSYMTRKDPDGTKVKEPKVLNPRENSQIVPYALLSIQGEATWAPVDERPKT